MENNGCSVDTVLQRYFYHVSTILFSFPSSTMYANDSSQLFCWILYLSWLPVCSSSLPPLSVSPASFLLISSPASHLWICTATNTADFERNLASRSSVPRRTSSVLCETFQLGLLPDSLWSTQPASNLPVQSVFLDILLAFCSLNKLLDFTCWWTLATDYLLRKDLCVSGTFHAKDIWIVTLLALI